MIIVTDRFLLYTTCMELFFYFSLTVMTCDFIGVHCKLFKFGMTAVIEFSVIVINRVHYDVSMIK